MNWWQITLAILAVIIIVAGIVFVRSISQYDTEGD